MEKCYPNNKTFWFLSFLRRKSLLCIYVFIGFLLIFSIKKSKGEGTKQLQPLATDNGFIQIFDNNTLTRPFATYNCPVDNRLNIHVSALGEKVYLGFNQPNNDVYFRVKDPLGNIVMGPTLLPGIYCQSYPGRGRASACCGRGLCSFVFFAGPYGRLLYRIQSGQSHSCYTCEKGFQFY
jgi:hypothetical protein